MSAFDERWKRCAEQARQGAEEPVPELSDALVTRVLARSQERQGMPLEAVWLAVGWRMLAVAFVLLAFSFVLETRAESDDSQMNRPPMEDIVVDEFWML